MAVFYTTANDVRGLLKRRYCQPEWATFFEVARPDNRTGYADAISMNMWSSRGLAIHGFEIKVSRSDWLKEMRDPGKSDCFIRYCDAWWLVAAKGIVKEGELPPTWGLYEIDGRGMVMSVKAPKLEPAEMSKPFMAAMMRRAGEFDGAEKHRLIQQATEQVRTQAAERVQSEIESRTRAYGDIVKAVREFEEISGLKISGWQGGKDVAKAVRVVQAIGVDKVYGTARGLINQARQFADSMDKHMTDATEALGGTDGSLFD